MIGGVGHESQNGNQEYLNVLAIFPNLKILQGHNSPENKENIFFWKLASGNSKYGKINILFAIKSLVEVDFWKLHDCTGSYALYVTESALALCRLHCQVSSTSEIFSKVFCSNQECICTYSHWLPIFSQNQWFFWSLIVALAALLLGLDAIVRHRSWNGNFDCAKQLPAIPEFAIPIGETETLLWDWQLFQWWSIQGTDTKTLTKHSKINFHWNVQTNRDGYQEMGKIIPI